MNPRKFVIDNAATISRLANANGNPAPQLSGDSLHDISVFEAWIGNVALLANGYECVAHNGSTYRDRVDAAKEIVAAYRSL